LGDIFHLTPSINAYFPTHQKRHRRSIERGTPGTLTTPLDKLVLTFVLPAVEGKSEREKQQQKMVGGDKRTTRKSQRQQTRKEEEEEEEGEDNDEEEGEDEEEADEDYEQQVG
jgi:hypothetical protein